MKNLNDLKKMLYSIDGKGYKSYKSLEGQYDFNKYVLSIDHVQGDPFAAPSKVRIIMNQKVAQIPGELFNEDYKRVAVQDFLTRILMFMERESLVQGKAGLYL